MIKIYFSDFFEVTPELVEEYGAFNVSLVNDLPLFIDPFLLFDSKKPQYRSLHDEMMQYLLFLRDRSTDGGVNDGLLKGWFTFPEVKQTWLGFSLVGNKGSGLGMDFARAIHGSLNSLLADFGKEKIASGSHLEKLCLINDGVGRDNISDFTTNLIKGYLLNYTQTFARKHIREQLRKTLVVEKVRFNYETESWERGEFDLPYLEGQYVLLTPMDMLTRDDTWINRSDLVNDYDKIAVSVTDQELRSKFNNYLRKHLSRKMSAGQKNALIASLYRLFPELLDYYIRYKEKTGDRARAVSEEKVNESKLLYIQKISMLAELLDQEGFYEGQGTTYDEARARVMFLKDVIENKDGYRVFYDRKRLITKEEDLHILFRLTWYGTKSDVNREVNNGRGPVDYVVSRGRVDKSLVEFKLASNPQLKRNLESQVKIYEKSQRCWSIAKSHLLL